MRVRFQQEADTHPMGEMRPSHGSHGRDASIPWERCVRPMEWMHPSRMDPCPAPRVTVAEWPSKIGPLPWVTRASSWGRRPSPRVRVVDMPAASSSPEANGYPEQDEDRNGDAGHQHQIRNEVGIHAEDDARDHLRQTLLLLPVREAHEADAADE